MTWREARQKGSYNGVSFVFRESEASVGRRVQLHQYPQRDKPYAEDLGRKARQFSLVCVFVGDNYHAARSAFIAEIEKPGAGTLIHPTFGRLRVNAFDVSVKESSRDGGMATVSVRFVESGANQFPRVSNDTLTQSEAAADVALVAVQQKAVNILSTQQKSGFVVDALSDLVADVSAALAVVTDQISAFGDAKSDVIANVAGGIDTVVSDISTLVKAPSELVGRLSGVVSDVFAGFDDVDAALSGFFGLSSHMATWPDVSAATPARRQQKDNQQAVSALVNDVALVSVVRQVVRLSRSYDVTDNSQSPFDSYDHAVSVQADLTNALDEAALAANDELYEILVDLHHKFVAHIRAHGSRLARIQRVTLQQSRPLLALLWSQYGDLSLEQDVIRRNNVRHPSFLAAGEPLEFLAAEPVNSE